MQNSQQTREAMRCSQEEAIIVSITLCLLVQWPFGTGRNAFPLRLDNTSYNVVVHMLKPSDIKPYLLLMENIPKITDSIQSKC